MKNIFIQSPGFTKDIHLDVSLPFCFNLDGNKISERYKIVPFNHFAFRHSKSKLSEFEELIITNKEGLTDLKKYLISISIFPQLEEDGVEILRIPDIIDFIKSKGLKYEIDKKWEEYFRTKEFIEDRIRYRDYLE